MYSFYLGDPKALRRDQRAFLLAIKRMLPRWANSLPDSEYKVLIDILQSAKISGRPVFVETGAGASTIVLIHFAMLYGGRAFTWDMNGSKGSYIRSVCAETLEPFHRKPISDHWTFVSSSSLSPHTGLPILPELTDRVDLSLHDSDHTWNTIAGEIRSVMPLLREGGVVCVDDANQDTIHTYEPIINVTRRKLGLTPIAPLPGNRAKPHYLRIAGLLEERFSRVRPVNTRFTKYLKDDPFYTWYELDRHSMDKVGMERLDTLSKRFGAWRVGKPRTLNSHVKIAGRTTKRRRHIKEKSS